MSDYKEWLNSHSKVGLAKMQVNNQKIIKRLNDEKVALVEKREALKGDVMGLETEKLILEDEKKELKKENREARKAVASKENSYQGLLSEKNKIQKIMDDLKFELDAVIDDNINMLKELDQCRKDRDQFKEDLRGLKKKLRSKPKPPAPVPWDKKDEDWRKNGGWGSPSGRFSSKDIIKINEIVAKKIITGGGRWTF